MSIRINNNYDFSLLQKNLLRNANKMRNGKFKYKLQILCVVFWISSFTNTLLLAQQSNSSIKLSLYENPIESTYKAIENAEQSVSAVIYKFDENSLLNVITDALNRGVKVKLVVDKTEANKKKSLVNKAKKVGADVRRWSGGKLHAKFTIIDNKIAIAGSFNWTKSANKNNVELLVVLTDLTEVSQFSLIFDDLWTRCGQEGRIIHSIQSN